MYDERFVTPMRQELTQLGVEEMRTPQEVDARLKDSQGTTLVVGQSAPDSGILARVHGPFQADVDDLAAAADGFCLFDLGERGPGVSDREE